MGGVGAGANPAPPQPNPTVPLVGLIGGRDEVQSLVPQGFVTSPFLPSVNFHQVTTSNSRHDLDPTDPKV